MTAILKKSNVKGKGDSQQKAIQKVIKGIEKRITQKALAAELGVSTSTLYRLKSGKTKNPKRNIIPILNEIWGNVKHDRFAKNLTEKEVKKEKLEHRYFYAEKIYFKPSRIYNHIYVAPILTSSILEKIVDEMQNRFNTNYFLARVVGIKEEMNKDGEMVEVEVAYSTKFVAIHLEGVEKLWDAMKVILSTSSKQLKYVKWFEVVAKEFLPSITGASNVKTKQEAKEKSILYDRYRNK